ncbi:unnamed protein product, partial [Prorocentrum cordatum]
ALYLPWVLACFALLMGSSIKDETMGIFVGHVYFFFEDVYPVLPTSKGFRLFRTPKLLKVARPASPRPGSFASAEKEGSWAGWEGGRRRKREQREKGEVRGEGGHSKMWRSGHVCVCCLSACLSVCSFVRSFVCLFVLFPT